MRLRMWGILLNDILTHTEKADTTNLLYTATESFVGPPLLPDPHEYWSRSYSVDASIEKLKELGQMKTIDLRDIPALELEAKRAVVVKEQIAEARERLAEFIKAHYSFEDLF